MSAIIRDPEGPEGRRPGQIRRAARAHRRAGLPVAGMHGCGGRCINRWGWSGCRHGGPAASRRPRWKALPALLLVWALLAAAGGCRRRPDLERLEQLARMSRPTYRGEPVSSETLREVEEVLDRYRRAVAERVERTEELGVMYRDLALRYLDINAIKSRIAEIRLASEDADAAEGDALYYAAMAQGYLDSEIYRQALVNLDEAMGIFPENPLLHYNAGVCAANIGKALVRSDQAEERAARLADAEAHYRRALELDQDYDEALYALSVLLVYELERPAEAELLLRRLLEAQPKNVEARFLLAAVYYLTFRYELALREYESIEDSSAPREMKEQARQNRERIMEEISRNGEER